MDDPIAALDRLMRRHTRAEIAARLGVHPETLTRWRRDGDVPKRKAADEIVRWAGRLGKRGG